jgi:hypothetical protein
MQVALKLQVWSEAHMAEQASREPGELRRMTDGPSNVLQLDHACQKRDDELRTAIVNQSLELAGPGIDKISKDLGTDPHDICYSLMLALLRRIAGDGCNPYDALDWVAEGLEHSKEAKAFQANAKLE